MASYLGVLNVCKVPGMSSHGVVSRVRRLVDMQRIGHAGTLDPAACGVLVVCLGKATRLSEYIASTSKSYRAEFLLGVTTASGDAEGEITGSADARHLDERAVADAIRNFTGVIRQRPPLHSAVQIRGERAYHIARRGGDVELPSREVTIHDFTLVRFEPGAHPRLLADITCSKGTYIRSLAIDLGTALGVGGTMSFLARTQVGPCRLEDALTLEEIDSAVQDGRFDTALIRPDDAVAHLPAIDWPTRPEDFRQGTPVPTAVHNDLYRAYRDGQFLGLARVEEGLLRPVVKLM